MSGCTNRRLRAVSLLLVAVSTSLLGCPPESEEPDEVLDGSTLWARRAGGPRDDQGAAVAVLAETDGLVAGQFAGSGVFGEGGANETRLFAQGLRDIFVARHGADGSLLWAVRAGGSGEEFATALTPLEDDDFLVTGYFEGTAVFGDGDPMRTVLTSAGAYDGFVARYDGAGSLKWARRFGGEGNDQAMDVAALSDGGFLVAGAFTGAITLQSATSGSVAPIPFGGLDGVVVRYDNLGRPIWSRAVGGTGDDAAYGVETLADDSCFTTGTFTDAASFGGAGTGLSALTAYEYDPDDESTHGNADLFVARYTREGALRWVRGAGGPGADVAYALSTTADGTSLVAGSYEATAYFGRGYALSQDLRSGGETDLFVAQYDGLGNFAWVAGGGGPAGDAATAVAALEDGSAAVGGSFTGRATFYSVRRRDPVTWTAKGESDAIVLYVNASGHLAWSHRVGGLRADACTALSGVDSARFLATGFFSGQASFPVTPPAGEDPAQTDDGIPYPTTDINLAAQGETDVFVSGLLAPSVEEEDEPTD